MDFVRTHRYSYLVLYFPVYIITFFIIEQNTPTSGYWVTDTALDAYIPFVPGFALFYIIWYPLFAAAGVPTLIWDGAAFKRWMYYLMIVLTGTLVFDVLVPNGQHLRPENVEIDGLGTWIMSIIWAADTPTNVFPSMHVLGCLGDIACVFDSKVFKPWMKAVVTVLSVLCTDRAYDGTAQGTDSYYGMSFSTQSGSALKLGDIFPDTGSLRALVRDRVLAQVEQMENAGEFTGVNEFVESALDGEGWYLTCTGLELKAAAGEIAPAELGGFEFEVPYTELEGLILSQYVPVPAEPEGASGPEAFSLGFDAPAAEPIASVLLDREAESFYLTAQADTAAFTLCGVGMGESFYVAYGQAPADEGFTARRGYVWVNGLKAGESIEVQGYFNDLPNYGLSFADGRLLLLAQSGKDGSLLIYEE